jgi:translocation and assembly module TamB
MLSRPAKISLWIGAGLLMVLALLVGTVFIVPNTDSGRAFIVREAAQLTNGQVRLNGIHGSFPAALDLDRLELRDTQGLWLWADHISLRWSPSALLDRHIDVDSLRIALLHVERSPVPDKEKKPSSSSSSSSIPHTELRDLTVDTLELGESLAGDPASLTVKGNARLNSLEDADAHITARRTDGAGNYEVTVHFDPQSMNAMVSLQEPAHGPLENLVKIPDIGALAVVVKLDGPRNAEALQLSVDAGPLQARANGRIDLQNKAADLTYSLTAPEMAPFDGLSWKRVELQGRFQGPFTQPQADGHLVIEALQAPGGAQLAELDAQLKGDKGFLSLQAGIDGLQIPGPAPGLLHDSRLTLDASIRLDEAQRPLTLALHHQLLDLDAKAIATGHQSADLTLHLPDLKPFAPLSGAPISGDAQLIAHVEYTPSLTQLTANLRSHLDGGAATWAGLVRGGLTQLQLAAKLSDQQIELDNVQLTGRAISVTATARADRTGEQSVKAQFDLGLPNLARISPALAGDLKINGSVEGPRQQLSADTHLTTSLSVRGSPRGTVTARVQARGLPQSPQGVLEASGQLDGAPLQVNVEVQPANGASYHAIIHHADWKSAHADGDVTLGKDVADARGHAKILVGQLSDFNRLAGSSLSGSINGQLSLTAQAGRPAAVIDLEAQNVVAGGVTANARLNAHGPVNAVQISLHADSPAVAGQPARIDTTSVINLAAKELQFASLQASYHDQVLHLLAPAKVQFAQGVKVQQLKLGIQDASIEVDGQLSPSLDVRAAVKQIKPELVNAFVPDLLVSGTLNADANLHGTPAAPTGVIHVQALNVRAKSVAAQGLPAADLRADANLNGNTADVDAHLTAGSSQLALTGRAPLAAGGSADLKLAGNLDLALTNPILEADGRHVTGIMAIDTTVTGGSANPQIAGTVRLSNGSLRDYGQGVGLTDITGQLSGKQGVLRIDQLTARAAPGNISIQGTIGVLQPKIPVSLTLTAKNAQPVASNLVTANLNADVKVNGTASERMDVNGTIHLNRTIINIPAGMPPEVTVLDVERDGAAPPSPAKNPLVINLNLTVEAPNQILIEGHGLDAEMGGTLHVRGTTAAPVVEGGFELQRGFFSLVNSKLTFTNGTVTFNGTGLQQKLDPSLDFTAQTAAADVTATVHITGLADKPELELTSTPEMPQDEILARLLFGEPAAQLTAVQLLETGAALSSLSSGGGGSNLNPLTRIQKALGLDRLSVGSGSTTSGSSSSSSSSSSGESVAAGRYVSSRVYVGVKESTTGASQVEVDVDLTKHLKLQTQWGNGTATAQGVTPENDPGSSFGLAYQLEY